MSIKQGFPRIFKGKKRVAAVSECTDTAAFSYTLARHACPTRDVSDTASRVVQLCLGDCWTVGLLRGFMSPLRHLSLDCLAAVKAELKDLNRRPLYSCTVSFSCESLPWVETTSVYERVQRNGGSFSNVFDTGISCDVLYRRKAVWEKCQTWPAVRCKDALHACAT